ncbi:hypothetical protein EDC01DRAFT_634118 [Geopyxis carbonaria]|nr:hypothetical protein EDC01DRAFT_634118 [Geopyxis carbonaria]
MAPPHFTRSRNAKKSTLAKGGSKLKNVEKAPEVRFTEPVVPPRQVADMAPSQPNLPRIRTQAPLLHGGSKLRIVTLAREVAFVEPEVVPPQAPRVVEDWAAVLARPIITAREFYKGDKLVRLAIRNSAASPLPRHNRATESSVVATPQVGEEQNSLISVKAAQGPSTPARNPPVEPTNIATKDHQLEQSLDKPEQLPELVAYNAPTVEGQMDSTDAKMAIAVQSAIDNLPAMFETMGVTIGKGSSTPSPARPRVKGPPRINPRVLFPRSPIVGRRRGATKEPITAKPEAAVVLQMAEEKPIEPHSGVVEASAIEAEAPAKEPKDEDIAGSSSSDVVAAGMVVTKPLEVAGDPEALLVRPGNPCVLVFPLLWVMFMVWLAFTA